jgi:putative ABC transport system permease protein
VLISLYISDELTYDSWHKDADRIYRIQSKLNLNGEINAALANLAVGPTLQQDYPEVKSFVRFMNFGQNVELTYKDNLYQEDRFWFSDSTLFDVFTYDFIAGQREDLLKTPATAVINNSLAQRIFGSAENAVGEQVKINNTLATVQAVIKDIPENSEFPFKGVVSITTLPQQVRDNLELDWFRIATYTFIKFNQPIDIDEFDAKLDTVNAKYVEPWAAQNGVVASIDYSLTPLSDLHFTDGFDYDLPKGNFSYILIFGLLALFILIIASINYVNLSLAQGSKRAKEVGVRKTLGADQKQIRMQFLGESILITALGIILGLGLVELLLNSFNAISNKNFVSGDIFSLELLIVLIGILLLVGIIAGGYPAFVLSSLKPVRVLRGSIPNFGGVGLFRKGLILVQFVFSLFMITGTLLIGNQMDYIHSKNLGFDRENVLSIPLPADTSATKALSPLVDELREDSRVIAVSRTNMPSGQSGEIMFRLEDEEGALYEKSVKTLFVDEHFIDVLGIDLIKGRNFSSEHPTDQQQAFIINETAAQRFNWNENAIDKRMQWGLLANGQATNDGKVVGVVSDFNFLSLHNPLEPLALCFNPNGSNTISVKLKAGDYSEVISDIRSSWEEKTTKHPFSFTFLDDAIEQNYTEEMNMYSIFKYFAYISILIALLGLFALLSFSVQTRTKEIGVRKILGASSARIAWILVRDFVLILVIAFAIATPLNIYLMDRWLEDFAYQVDYGIVSPGMSLLLAAGLSVIVVFYHAYKINRTDPAFALRYE